MKIKKLTKGILFVTGIFFVVLFIEMCFFSCSAVARPSKFKLLEADEISVDALRVADYRHGYYVKDSDKFSHGANFNLNLRLCKYMFIENRVHFLGTPSQIRQGGWEYRAGFDMGKYLQAFYYHHSQHVFERDRGEYNFPLENMYGIRFIFVKKGRK